MNANSPDSSIPDPPTLVIFCRRPAPGHGKQRIAADLGAGIALELARHLLATTLEDAVEWPGPVIISPSSATDTHWAGALLSRPFEVISQPDGNLGDRINAVDKAAREAGHTHLIYIGSDAPTLDAGYFAQARAALASHDVVLGPAEDGGVTLMGAKTAWPKLTELPWSTDKLAYSLEQTCLTRGLTVYRLGRSYDIDVAENLPRLYDDLINDPRPARQHLRRWLAALQPIDKDQGSTGAANEGKY